MPGSAKWCCTKELDAGVVESERIFGNCPSASATVYLEFGMRTPPTRPFLVVYVAWHPAFSLGERLARHLFDHYRRDLYASVIGGTGLPVVYRSVDASDAGRPLDIDLSESETTAIVLLIDENWAKSDAWVSWANRMQEDSETQGLRTRVFPVTIDSVAAELPLIEQAAAWHTWDESTYDDSLRRLIANLTYQFCRMLRSYLEHLRRPDEPDAALEKYLKKVEIFLSHSKHDSDGEKIAREIRERLSAGDGLGSFFDVHDIPIGLAWGKVLLQKVRTSAMVAIHTDTYSSREWCRREILEAKRWSVPLVVAHCVHDVDERAFPYLGNVPQVRMDSTIPARIDVVVSRLLDEVLKEFLWQCWTQMMADVTVDNVIFVPRSPELIMLASLDDGARAETTLVYPDPALGAEEERLFEVVAPKVRLRSRIEWLAESGL
jgi:hypothetical protein